jgi:hypothetical protein
MRYFFGLGGILITLAVIVMIMKYAWLPHTQAVLDAGDKATQTVDQIAGVDSSGMRASDTVQFEQDTNNAGQLHGLRVKSIVAGGPIEKYFGLQKDDVIIASVLNGADQRVADFDYGADKDFVMQAYQTGGQVKVMRPGVPAPLTLPAVGSLGPLGGPGFGSTGSSGNGGGTGVPGLPGNIPTH